MKFVPKGLGDGESGSDTVCDVFRRVLYFAVMLMGVKHDFFEMIFLLGGLVGQNYPVSCCYLLRAEWKDFNDTQS